MKLCLVKVVLMLIITSYKGMVDGELPGAICYWVSHDKYSPDWKYHIYDDFRHGDHATTETCQEWCAEDVNCKSVLYKIDGDRRHFCHKFNISVQELNDTGRDNVIYNGTVPTYITYDRNCPVLPGAMCTYPVSHDRKSPEWQFYNIDDIRDDNATVETCWEYCNGDENCRSVQYIIREDGARFCYKYNISVQELKVTLRYIEIHTETNKNWATTYITYDRDCAVYRFMCSNTYPVSHDREYPYWNIYDIHWKRDDSATSKTCQDWCTEDVRCRSVSYEIYNDGRRWCTKNSISLSELKDAGRYHEIYNEYDTDTWPTFITYDRDCECPPGLEPSSLLVGFCKTCSPGFFKPSRGSEKCTKCVYGEVSKDKTSCVWVSPTTKGPGTDVDEVSPATKGPGTNVAAIGEPMIVLIVMIGAGAVFVAPVLPGAEVAF